MKRILAITLTLVMLLAALTGCMASKNPSGSEGEQPKQAQCLSEENGVYKLTLPKSKEVIELYEEQVCFVPYITDALVEVAENKITEDVSQHSNHSNFFLQITNDYLCLVVEVIKSIDPPVSAEEGEIADGGCGIDHEHLFFSERISSKAVADNKELHFGTSDEDYGKIQFFPQPTLEFTEEDTYDTTVLEWTRLTDGDVDLLRQVYNDGKGWIDDSVVDRALFMFDGRIRFATTDSFGWMYFGLEQNVLYYNGMFTGIDDSVRKIIEIGRQNDINTEITFSAGEVLSQKVLSDSDKQTIMNILSIKTDNAWISDIPECDWICRFSGAVEVGYCDCGTLSDFANHRSRKLTNAEKEKIEELIKRYKYNSNEECFDNVIGKVPLHPLYEKYPEYWDVDGMKGVEVYVWQIEDGSYRCGALTGTNRLKTDEEIQTLFDNGATIEEMRTILELCEVAKDHISLIPISNPLADNWYEIDINDEALLKVQTLFWGE